MRRGERTIHIPNEQTQDVSVGLLARLLREAGIDRETL